MEISGPASGYAYVDESKPDADVYVGRRRPRLHQWGRWLQLFEYHAFSGHYSGRLAHHSDTSCILLVRPRSDPAFQPVEERDGNHRELVAEGEGACPHCIDFRRILPRHSGG